MKVIRPFAVTPASLTSNIAETDAGEYNAATTYALADRAIWTTGTGATHHLYESLTAGNVGNALTDASKWLDLGPTNRWAMFDQKTGTVTTGATGIDATVQATGRADGLGLFGLDAHTVHVVMSTGAEGVVYDQTFSLQSDSGVTSWYDYFSEEIEFKTELVVTDLPMYTDPAVQVVIERSTGGSVTCGTMVLGQTRDIGAAVYGAKAGIQDYSRKEVDDFGVYTIVERSFAKRLTVNCVVERNRVDSIYNLLAAYRAIPVVWVGSDDYAMTWIFGFYKDFTAEIASPTTSNITIEIEGLT